MKAFILSEIQRLAAENGGKAPGKIFFQRETGITENDWYGKIWLRWSDAISEAGFTPNAYQMRLSSDYVLDKYAEICRHFGRPPLRPELRIYAQNNPDFISHNTFTKHFGSKEGIIAALRERSIKRGEADLIAILPECNNSVTAIEGKEIKKLEDGWVYLLQSGKYFKIGRSDEIEKRIKQIAVALPETTTLIHAIRTDDPPGIESYWHRRFSDKRKNGEWFELSGKDVSAFKKRKFQ